MSIAKFGIYVNAENQFTVKNLIVNAKKALLLFFLWYECEALLEQRIALLTIKLLNRQGFSVLTGLCNPVGEQAMFRPRNFVFNLFLN